MSRQWNDLDEVHEGLRGIGSRRLSLARWIPSNIPGAVGRRLRQARFLKHYKAMQGFGLAERLLVAEPRERYYILQIAELMLGPSLGLYLSALGPSNTGAALYFIQWELARKDAARRLGTELQKSMGTGRHIGGSA